MSKVKHLLEPLPLRSDFELKRKYLGDIYRKEGDMLATQNDFKGAVKKYTEVSKTFTCSEHGAKYLVVKVRLFIYLFIIVIINNDNNFISIINIIIIKHISKTDITVS